MQSLSASHFFCPRRPLRRAFGWSVRRHLEELLDAPKLRLPMGWDRLTGILIQLTISIAQEPP